MDVLLIGSDNPLGDAVTALVSRWGRHNISQLTSTASRWRSERQAKKAARKGKPQAVVDLRLAWQVAAGEIPQSLDIERTHWLAKACERSEIQYLLLSSDQVFAGLTGRSLREVDGHDAHHEPGVELVEAEDRVFNAAPSAIVLRTGPLFAGTDINLLTQILWRFDAAVTAASANHDPGQPEVPSALDNRSVFCPVSTDDAARVLVAMLDQLSVGAQASGVYHYCSGDRATEFGFAETVLAASSQYRDYGDVTLLSEEESNDSEQATTATRVLDCSRLRDGFAVKQVSWRQFIDPAVRQFHDVPESRSASV